MPEPWDRPCEPVRVAVAVDSDPDEVLRSLGDERLPFGLVGNWAGGGAILGSEPIAVVSGCEALDLPQPACDSNPEGLVGGGWVGYYGYGLGASIERLPPAPPRPHPIPLAQMAFYDHVLRLDPAGDWWVEALWPSALEHGAERLRKLLSRPRRAERWRLGPMRPAAGAQTGHRAAVAECVERIAAGELFQANICLRLAAEFEGSAVGAFAEVSRRLQPTYGAFVGMAEGAILSFSPELFLRRAGRRVTSAPIKGTAPRSDDRREARRTHDQLRGSAKDAAEHVMIVDLMRNDIGRVARYGSVRADEEPRLEPHPGLWHLVTTVTGELRPDVSDGELLRATFPPGSVTGAPKVQAQKVISDLEGTAREAYTGAVGIVSPVSGLELNVAIRTLEISGGSAWLGCGGGIVAESDPEQELREAIDKAEPIVRALGSRILVDADRPGHPDAGRSRVPLRRLLRRPDPAAGLYETFRVLDGVVVDLESHLQRLADGLQLEYGTDLPDELRDRLVSTAAGAVDRIARLRVDVSPIGESKLQLGRVTGPAVSLKLMPVMVTGGLGSRKLADREPLLAFEGPGRAGLICDIDGEALEVTSGNIWALVDGELITPPTDGRILPGVTRAAILGLGTAGGHSVGVRRIALDELSLAEALLVTSSVRIAAPATIDRGDGEQSPSLVAQELAAVLRSALDSRARGYPPAEGNELAADWSRPAHTALAPRSPTRHTM